jgi:hypothetical protein
VGPDPIVILTLWILTLRSPHRALGLAGLSRRVVARFVMTEFANEKMSYRS